MQGLLGSGRARPVGKMSCKACWEVVVQGPLGSSRARPVGKWSCKAHWEVVVQGPLGSGRARPRADRKKVYLAQKKIS